MKKTIIILLLPFISFSCINQGKVNLKNFRTGTFEIPAGKGFDKTTFIRTDSLQIEFYQNRTDSLSIVWKNNFNYTLRMLHPKSDLDREPIRVKITGVKAISYDFEAVVGHSNFKQKGKVIKIAD